MRVNRKELLGQLEAVAPGLSKRGDLEQSDCFAFDGGRVYTFNDEVACSVPCPLELKGAVAAKPLLGLLRKLTEDELDVEVMAGGAVPDEHVTTTGELVLKGKRRRAGIRMEGELLLPVDSIGTPKGWRPLPEGFSEAVGIVASSAGRDESQFVLTCVHIAPEWLEACDQFQLCRYPMATGLKKPMLLRATSLRFVAGVDVTEWGRSDGWMHFRNPVGLMLSCRSDVENYPSLDKLLEADGVRTVWPKELAEAVDKAEIFSGEVADANMVEVSLGGGRLKLEGRGPSGWYTEQKKAEYVGEPMSFMISPKLLREIVRRTDHCFVSGNRLRVDGGKFTYVACIGVPKG